MSASNDASHMEENKSEDAMSFIDGEEGEEDLATRFGFKQVVSLDMELPTTT